MKVIDPPDATAPLEDWQAWLWWLENYHNNYTPRGTKKHQRKMNHWRRQLINEAEEMIVTKQKQEDTIGNTTD